MRQLSFACLLIPALSLPAAITVAAQSPPVAAERVAAESPEDTFARALKIFTESGARPALPLLEQALARFRAKGDRSHESAALRAIGNCHRDLGEMPTALEMLRASLAISQEIGNRSEQGKTLSSIGRVEYVLASYSAASGHYRQAIAIFQDLHDSVSEGSVRNNLGLALHQLGDFKSSLEEYQHALALYQSSNFDRGMSDVIGNIGLHYLDLGRYEEALNYYQQSLPISERLNSDPEMSLDLGNIGFCYSALGKTADALQSFARAEALARSAGQTKELADWQKGQGSAYLIAGQYDQALAHYKLSRDTYEKAGYRRELIDILGDLGQLHLSVGDFASAQADFRKAIEVSRSIHHPRGVMQNLVALADLESRRKRFAEAVPLLRQALDQARAVGEQTTLASGEIQLALAYRELGRLDSAQNSATQAAHIARDSGAPALIAGAEYAQGEVARSQGEFSDSLEHLDAADAELTGASIPDLSWRVGFARGQVFEKLERDEEALAAYRQAIEIIEDVRGQLSEERFRSGYLEDKFQVYVAIVEVLLRMGRVDDAFLFAERLRARSFLDLINRQTPPGRTPEQVQQEMSLRGRIRKLQGMIEDEDSKPEAERKRAALDRYSSELADSERAYLQFLDDLERTDPRYAQVRLVSVPSLRDVQARIPGDTALVEYLVGGKEVSIFVVRSDSIRAKSVPMRAADLRGKVELLRDLIAREQGESWRLPARSLYQALVQPVRDQGWLAGTKRVYLVPHGILHYVPFAALPTSAAPAGHLLIDDFEIAYLPAASALVFAPDNALTRPGALVVAPAFTRLHFTQDEAHSVAGDFNQDGRLLLGKEATKTSFESLAGQYGVLHLATHGFFNRSNPALSGVVLEPDASGDGRLEVHEILGLHLDARLVTLSACETALGSGYFSDVPAGDDLVGLTRAFLFAGSSSVLASLWEVDDRSTMELMRGFYQQFGHADKVSSLAEVQRLMRRSGGKFGHPYYWGAFVLVGQMN